jgi:hypothetical protein
MDHRCKDADKGNLKWAYSGKNLFQCHFMHDKLHVNVFQIF